MKTPKLTRRNILLAIPVLLVSGLILMGFLIAHGTIMAPPDLDGASVAALLHLRTLQGTGSEPAQEVDDLQVQVLGHDVEEFRDGAVAPSVMKAISKLPQVAP